MCTTLNSTRKPCDPPPHRAPTIFPGLNENSALWRQVVFATPNDSNQETVWFFEASSQTNTTNATKYLQVGQNGLDSPENEQASLLVLFSE